MAENQSQSSSVYVCLNVCFLWRHLCLCLCLALINLVFHPYGVQGYLFGYTVNCYIANATNGGSWPGVSGSWNLPACCTCSLQGLSSSILNCTCGYDYLLENVCVSVCCCVSGNCLPNLLPSATLIVIAEWCHLPCSLPWSQCLGDLLENRACSLYSLLSMSSEGEC